MDENSDKSKRLFCGIIWCKGDGKAGERFEVFAADLTEAQRLMEERFGVGYVFTLYSPEDADKPR
jgi:hypothetical protein